MDGGHNMSSSSSSSSNNTGTMTIHHMMMHMTFFWGKHAEILFSGWPGTSSGMYVFALICLFLLAMSVEWLSHSRFIRQDGSNSNVHGGVLQTVLHTVRVGLSYLVMLAVMSYNGGVFLVVVAGHSVGFLIFGSRVFKQDDVVIPYEKRRDLPPMTC